jgi:hypothetical protein
VKRGIELVKYVTKYVSYTVNCDGALKLTIGKIAVSETVFEDLFQLHLENGYAVLSGFCKERVKLYELLCKIIGIQSSLLPSSGLFDVFYSVFDKKLEILVNEAITVHDVNKTIAELSADLIGCLNSIDKSSIHLFLLMFG